MLTIGSAEDLLRQLRLRHQRLTHGARASSASETLRHLFALQSQEWPAAQLALHARTHGIAQADVIHAREVQRSFVLTWALRGTLHLLPSQDLRWLLALCASGAIRASKSRYAQLGLSDTVREQALPEIATALRRDCALTRSQLAQALAARGIPVKGQAIHHLVRFAALRGLICLGPERGGDLTYVLLDHWLPAAIADDPPADPLAELARRYLNAYAPATAADFARWSGLSAKQVKAAWQAIAADCAAILLPDGEALILKTQLVPDKTAPAGPVVRFLPRYDNYLLGYASRAFMVADDFAKRVHPGGGLIRACVIVDGAAIANWKIEKRRKAARLVVTPFEPLNSETVAALHVEAESLSAFLDSPLELRLDNK